MISHLKEDKSWCSSGRCSIAHSTGSVQKQDAISSALVFHQQKIIRYQQGASEVWPCFRTEFHQFPFLLIFNMISNSSNYVWKGSLVKCVTDDLKRLGPESSEQSLSVSVCFRATRGPDCLQVIVHIWHCDGSTTYLLLNSQELRDLFNYSI